MQMNPKAVARGALMCLALGSAAGPANAQEPAECLSQDPAHWPQPSKPYFMVIADTSGSMSTAVTSANSCALTPNDRKAHARCALRNLVKAFSGVVNFGLATFAAYQTGCAADCSSGCLAHCFSTESPCQGCGPRPGDATTRAGANIVVPMKQDNFWQTPPSADNTTELLGWVDGSCAADKELYAMGATPLNGALRDMKRYFQTSWTRPGTTTTFTTPLATQDLSGTGVNGSTGCRSVNIILLTDGDETCDTQQDAVNAAADLYSNGVTVGGKTFKIRTFVINFIGANTANSNAIAAAGGTATSYSASNETELSVALTNIIRGTAQPETCNNKDDNCNGCTDEGFTHYCNVQQTCCPWGVSAQRTTCLTQYAATITLSNPQGDRTKLPCTTAAQQSQPTNWLCYNPGETCDNVDNNCQSGMDEGVLKCGNPLHCPYYETCNGQDDDCNGQIDENACPGCVPSPEVCDGCDNDCDGTADEGITPIPCGQSSPPNCNGTIVCSSSPVSQPGGCTTVKLSACSYNPQNEDCDGVDDNCNGVVDDGVPSASCVPSGTPPGLNYGPNSQCKQGQQACGANQCLGFVGPSTEVCDGIDNDCDGVVDDNPFGVGLPCGINQPPCQPGLTACVNGALRCQGGVLPAAEECDGIDNDCDGTVDEPPLADQPPVGMNGCWDIPGNCCTYKNYTWCPPPGATCNGMGALTPPCTRGVLTCAGTNLWTCSKAHGPSAEECDGLDNNCNGQEDEGLLGAPCGTHSDGCTMGTLQCLDGVVECVGGGGSHEVCDGQDNDCDGMTDENLDTVEACTAPYDEQVFPGLRVAGVCRPGVRVCRGASGGSQCQGAVGPGAEVCDGVDNDCDGFTDEAGPAPDGVEGSADPTHAQQVVGQACGFGPTDLCRSGTLACVNGFVRCTGLVPVLELCDGVDNDCNGSIDDGADALCGPGMRCVQQEGTSHCAPECGASLAACPTGQQCQPAVASGTSVDIGTWCTGVHAANAGMVPSALSRVESLLGCACAEPSARAIPWLALGLAAVVVLRRRRPTRRGMGLAVASLLGLLSGCPPPDDDDTSSSGGGGAVSTDTSGGNVSGSTSGRSSSGLQTSSSRSGGTSASPTSTVSSSSNPGSTSHKASSGTGISSTSAPATSTIIPSSTSAPGSGTGSQSQGGSASTTSGGGTTSHSSVSSDSVPTSGQGDTSSGTDSSHGATSTATSASSCVISPEVCDGVDNNCNDQVDETTDFTSPATCGTCETNCFALLDNFDPVTITCTPVAGDQRVPGTCGGSCAPHYHDRDTNPLDCETFCVALDTTDATCDHVDDDCDGITDDEVDLCSLDHCGDCGWGCHLPNAVSTCTRRDPAAACSPTNSVCRVERCTCTDADTCWIDQDHVANNGCEVRCSPTNNGVEICGDNLDNDCDGLVDGEDDLSGDPQNGVVCFGDPDGVCAMPEHAGVTTCVANRPMCTGPNVLREGDVPETCNGQDDDCNGILDDNAQGVGSPCGQSNIFPCSFGTLQCVGGQLLCKGDVNPGTETCNGVDDNCDGSIDLVIDQPPTDSVGDCDVPVPPPPGATSPCKAGSKACVGGQVVCNGATGPSSTSDACGVDANCDGVLTNQPDKQSDVANCGTCGNNCLANSLHANWACVNGTCAFRGCQTGYYDLDGDNKCEYPCQFISAQEQCNGMDDNCNGQFDESLNRPGPVQVCGVSPSAIAAECTTNVSVACVNGTWQCTFPAGVCPGGCSSDDETCDALDNDCDGVLNENVNFGKPCSSDDGLPPPGHGACRTTGSMVCNGPSAVMCNAQKANCANLPGGCTEHCDGIDNDCDGKVDEPYSDPGVNTANFVKPAVTKIADSKWIMSYEASRPNATNVSPGTGNGYWTSAPAGVTLDKTPACSVGNKIPWFNVTPREVTQTCQAMGGTPCSVADWVSACQATASCTWGYNPRGLACTSGYTSSKYCNLGPSYDFNAAIPGDQDGLLPTALSALQNCWADWSNQQGNTAATNKVFDLTGNVREITSSAANSFAVMGGAFNTADATGAECNFTFYTVDQDFLFFDTGFRCCFPYNPSP